jgi:hypothetical protein
MIEAIGLGYSGMGLVFKSIMNCDFAQDTTFKQYSDVFCLKTIMLSVAII